jgi:hypothetical protein
MLRASSRQRAIARIAAAAGTASLVLAVMLTVVPVASARVPNACTLLTGSQAQAALGTKLQWKQRQGDKFFSVCTWHGEPYNASAYGHPTLMLTLNKSTPARFRRGFNLSRTAVRVRGIGDMAYTTSGMVHALYVLGKGYALMLTIPQDRGLPWAKTVAGEALSHL